MYCRGQERVGPCLYFQNAFRRLYINKFTFNFKPFDSVFPHYMRLWYWTSKHCTYIPIDKGLSRFVKIFFLYVKLVLFFASLFYVPVRQLYGAAINIKLVQWVTVYSYIQQCWRSDAVCFALFLTLRGHLTGTDQINHVDVETKITMSAAGKLRVLLCRYEMVPDERRMHIAWSLIRCEVYWKEFCLKKRLCTLHWKI